MADAQPRKLVGAQTIRLYRHLSSGSADESDLVCRLSLDSKEALHRPCIGGPDVVKVLAAVSVYLHFRA
jgi:hypothetical protein